MTDTKRERIAKHLLEIFRGVWCDRESDSWPYFNCSVCEFEDGEECILKQFIKNTKYETEYPQGTIKEDLYDGFTVVEDIIVVLSEDGDST